jgi:heat shock protein HslJ
MISRGRLIHTGAVAGISAVLVAMLTTAPVAAAEFPFEQELLLDAKPMPGSKRVPILEVQPNGRAHVDLWCKSGEALVTVVGDTIVVTLGPMPDAPCTPERMQADAQTAEALSQVSQWHLEEDVLVLTGPTPLRFHLSTH